MVAVYLVISTGISTIVFLMFRTDDRQSRLQKLVWVACPFTIGLPFLLYPSGGWRAGGLLLVVMVVGVLVILALEKLKPLTGDYGLSPGRRRVLRVACPAQLCDMCAEPVLGDGANFRDAKLSKQWIDLYCAQGQPPEKVYHNGVGLADGRVVCLKCREDGRYTVEEIEDVRREVLDVMKTFGMVLTQPAPLRVVDAAEMAAHFDRVWQPTEQLDARPMGAYAFARDGEQMLVESGQPRRSLLWTLAHECAHDWHSDNNPAFPWLDLEIKEGFAQWAADEVASRLGVRAEAERQLTRRDVYGLAPLKYFHLEFVAGVAEVLAFATQIGTARASRLARLSKRGDRSALERGRSNRGSGWQTAVDFSADAERFARQGFFFASSLCCSLAVRAMPGHPHLWWHCLRRKLVNFLLLLTWTIGRPVASAICWVVAILFNFCLLSLIVGRPYPSVGYWAVMLLLAVLLGVIVRRDLRKSRSSR